MICKGDLILVPHMRISSLVDVHVVPDRLTGGRKKPMGEVGDISSPWAVKSIITFFLAYTSCIGHIIIHHGEESPSSARCTMPPVWWRCTLKSSAVELVSRPDHEQVEVDLGSWDQVGWSLRASLGEARWGGAWESESRWSGVESRPECEAWEPDWLKAGGVELESHPEWEKVEWKLGAGLNKNRWWWSQGLNSKCIVTRN